MTRQIFIGSSSESVLRARQLKTFLASVPDTVGVVWEEFFKEPGYLTFEVLERVLETCCAAIFVANPDDKLKIRGREALVPRGNVLLEFGLMAARFGHHSTAVCTYGGAELPSDFDGLTTVNMGSAESSTLPEDIDKVGCEALRIWLSRLVATTTGIARTEVVHGYTGLWRLDMQLQRWRDLVVTPPDSVYVDGSLHLSLACNGQTGNGLAHAELSCRLSRPGTSTEAPYDARYRTSHEITNAVCHRDGVLEFASKMLATKKMRSSGHQPAELSAVDDPRESWSARWVLSPTDTPRALQGTMSTEGPGITEATVRATRQSQF
jgi:hypothetical protein